MAKRIIKPEENNNIAIVTAIWKRHDITKHVLAYFTELKKEIPNMVLIAVGSEGEVSRKLAEDNGWNYVEYQNIPVSQKWNRVTEEVRKYDVIGMMIIGSDDVVSKEVIQYYQKNYNRETSEFIGFDRCYYYDILTKQLVCGNWQSFPEEMHKHKLIGLGRFYSKKILEQIDYKPWGTELLNRGLDACSSRVLKPYAIKEIQIPLDFKNGFILDVKSRQNLNGFDYVKYPEHIDVSVLHELFPEFMKNIDTVKDEIPFKELVKAGEIHKYKVLLSNVWENGRILTLETTTALAINKKHKLELIS